MIPRLGFGSEWLIIRYGGQMQGPYRSEEDARRDFSGLRGACLVRRRVWRGRWLRKCMEYAP